MSKESFKDLFEESINKVDLRKGSVVKATVVDVRPDRITVNAGLKSDAIIPAEEFRNADVNVGDAIDVVVVNPANAYGETLLSFEAANRAKAWKRLAVQHEAGEIVTGVLLERVKGGFTVEVDSIRAFLPGSLVDVKPVRDSAYLEGKELEFKIIKMDQKRNNVVVSRRAVVELESSADRSAKLDELQEGQEILGVVKNITDYGAFVDLGGIDGLLHITDMAWKRVKHPSELLNVGDEINVKILKFDREKNRVSLGLKQMGEDPWENIARRYPTGTRVFGRITNITDYGCFVELEEGVEGLVHMSEMDWTNKNVHPSKVVTSGEEVEVLVLEIDEDRRRISLGIKQCKANPWDEYASQHEIGEKVSGKVRSLTDFGMFIGLDGNIDGLVHLSDISWSESGETAVRNFKKGDDVEAVILAIDPERERISLGIKQLQDNPVAGFLEGLDKDEIIKATATEVDAKQAMVTLRDDLTGVMRLADYTYDRIKDLREVLKVGDEVDVKIVNVDSKTNQILVSHKVLETRPDEEGTRSVGEATKTTLGDLLKEQMKDKSE